MADYLLVESQGPWTGPACCRFLEDALALADMGHRVWLFLVEDGVTGAVGRTDASLDHALRAGVRVWIDTFSVRRRALADTALTAGTELVDMETLAGKLLEPAVRVVWH